jgi:REP-associated tyrosine transposase
LAAQKECRIEEGHLMAEHVHMLLSIPPKYSVAQVVGFLKGKAAIHIARTFMGRRKHSTGHHCGARGYYVSTVGRDEAVIHEYIRTQEAEDRRLDQMDLW